MAASPLAFLGVVVVVTTFNGLLFGSELVESSFPEPTQPETGCSGFFDKIGCIATTIGNVFKALWGGVVFVFKLVSIAIPGAPWYVQVPISSFVFAGYSWSFMTFLRGN